MQFKIEWYYLTDIETLISAYQGKFTKGVVTTTYIRDELIRRLIAMVPGQKELLKDTLLDQGKRGEYPLLIKMIKEEAEKCRQKDTTTNKTLYKWEDASKIWPFDKLHLCKRVPNNEIIITPDIIVIPWPFPIKNAALKTAFLTKVAPEINNEIKDFSTIKDQIDIRRDVRTRKALDVIDRTNKDLSPDERNEMNGDRGKFHKRCGSLEDLPPASELLSTIDIKSNHSFFSIDTDINSKKIGFVVGLDLVNNDPTGTRRVRPVHEPHPDGAFSLECAKPT